MAFAALAATSWGVFGVGLAYAMGRVSSLNLDAVALLRFAVSFGLGVGALAGLVVHAMSGRRRQASTDLPAA
jgi:hypothetical protein